MQKTLFVHFYPRLKKTSGSSLRPSAGQLLWSIQFSITYPQITQKDNRFDMQKQKTEKALKPGPKLTRVTQIDINTKISYIIAKVFYSCSKIAHQLI